MVKNSKRGNIILVDPTVLHFIPNLHLTPQAMVNVNNLWKDKRPVFDSSFRPEIWCHAINDWIDKATEGEVYFPSLFERFLIWVYNMLISYPNQPIYLCDDDITNAFRLVKINPDLVSMHAYVGCGKLALCTGNTFGNTNCPANFDQPALARSQHATWLFQHRGDECERKCSTQLNNIETEDMDDSIPFTAAQADSLNPGVINKDGSCQPSQYVSHVDDHLYAEVLEYLRRVIACSFVSADDTFGGSHVFQEDLISVRKLNMLYKEIRTLLSYLPNLRTMMVELSPRRREKIIKFIIKEGWLHPNKRASIRDIARILGLLQSICDIFIWGQAQLLVLQHLLADQIRAAYNVAQRNRRIDQLFLDESAKLPTTLLYRLTHLKTMMQLQFLWKSRSKILINRGVTNAIKKIYDFLVAGNKWESPIGHLIPRDMASISFGDASFHGVGVVNDDIKAIILLPFQEKLFRRMQQKKVHINIMELIILFLGYIMYLHYYESLPDGTFPPHPQIKLWGDNMSANEWFRTFSTNSAMATNALLMFAEYMKYSPVLPVPDWIKRSENVQADDLSRIYKLFPNDKPFIYDVPYPILLQQVCHKYNEMSNYNVFLPHPDIISDISYLVYSDYSTAVPKRRKSLGRFFPVSSIFSGFVNNTIYSNSFFL